MFKNHYKGHGLREQAIEFARCKNLGLIQSPLMPHSEKLDEMKSMDIIREQIGIKYPNDKYKSASIGHCVVALISQR